MTEVAPTYDTNTRKNLFLSEIKDLYRYKSLIFHLVRRNVTARYKRSVLGVAWTLLDPLATMFIMALIFSSFFGSLLLIFLCTKLFTFFSPPVAYSSYLSFTTTTSKRF